jgi:hypothetical protein
MGEPMSVLVEVWPVAADDLEIWLLSGGDAWRSMPVPADNEPHAELELLIYQHMGAVRADLYHSTSWRADGPHVILTYVAVFHSDLEFVRGRWADALPITPEMYEKVGRPPSHEPTDPPTPRYVDVLLHAIRHLRFLKDTDASARAAMTPAMQERLSAWEPALSGMYGEHQQSA